jgi:YspA, cpYpsA-related SLOG family
VRVLVCGGRDFEDGELVYSCLDAVRRERDVTAIITGDATGADTFARRWAHDRGVACHTFEANWKAHGKAAGILRNEYMLRVGRPDIAVVFPGGRGTADMVARLRWANVKRIVIKSKAGGMYIIDETCT